MRTIIFFGFIVLCLLIACNPPTKRDLSPAEEMASIEEHPDFSAVHSTIEDYLLALYEVDSTRIEKSVDKTLRKIGYWYNEEENQYRDDLEMSYDQLHSLAAEWNSKGNRLTEDSPREIKIYDIRDKTAIGKLNAEWGMDFFQLAKVNGRWIIKNIIWQSYPPDLENS